MKAKEADAIMEFLENCEGLLSNHEMMALCNGLRNANDDSSDGIKNAVWFNACGHYEKAFSKEYGEFV